MVMPMGPGLTISNIELGGGFPQEVTRLAPTGKLPVYGDVADIMASGDRPLLRRWYQARTTRTCFNWEGNPLAKLVAIQMLLNRLSGRNRSRRSDGAFFGNDEKFKRYANRVGAMG